MIRAVRRAGLGNFRSQDGAEVQLSTQMQRTPKGNVLVIGNSGVGPVVEREVVRALMVLKAYVERFRPNGARSVSRCEQ